MKRTTTDQRLLRGDRTRRQILTRAVDIASAEGLASVSLGRLAYDLGLSKSGVNGHFAGRQALQLAVVSFAARLYADRVGAPAMAAPEGLPRVWAFCHRWLEFMRSGELSGRSFFLTAVVDYDARPGAVRDTLLRYRRRWETVFTQNWEQAQNLGHVRAGIDPRQLFLEVAGLITVATLDAQLCGNLEPFDLAQQGIRQRLLPLLTDQSTISQQPTTRATH
ncbi:TetR/AcrR family transcriptional regulator [Nakamurella sp. PAMC28650]|uniref:TetR/AcrR family transcriptional regulator n=1 Tax=Nakamurella sp. PAMC28650 TaxID=2762325 RepID=UPI00164DEEE1|nr:TetR/AcrR family transcriptional regulator [Nakamurella sp. PAMC28650]QNK80407.1 TetR/AcrR family transcriptional regulator [Nakamurella sp. PAMC28650]